MVNVARIMVTVGDPKEWAEPSSVIAAGAALHKDIRMLSRVSAGVHTQGGTSADVACEETATAKVHMQAQDAETSRTTSVFA